VLQRRVETEAIRRPPRHDLADFFTAETFEIVTRLYQRDFELLAYTET